MAFLNLTLSIHPFSADIPYLCTIILIWYGKKVRFPRHRLGHCRDEFRAESGAKRFGGPYLQGRHGRGQHILRTGGHRLGDQPGGGQLREAHRRHHDSGRLDQRPRRRGEWGVHFDKKEDGTFDLHREGGHSEFRILHHQDNTGAEIQTSLIEAVKQHPNITIFTNHYAVEIITQHHLGIIVTRYTPGIKCYGAYVLDEETGEVDTFLSKVTIMATGGCEAVYRHTTNPLVATGDGIAMVYRAKGAVKDMEFIQFHPTALYHPGDRPSFLITEAMRGYGAVLRTLDGKEFMQKYDPRLSLAPRDIVARAIDNEMKQRGEDHVYLDVTHKDAEETKRHFPNIYQKCLSIGIDITKDYIPVAPAAHYLCGGIKVDLDGQSSIRRLYAIGECSCTGLHGGNRLASNSLIEAVVYADAAAKHALSVLDRYDFNTDIPEWNDEGTISNEERVLITQSMKEVNQIMEAYVGIVRSNVRLTRAWNRLDILYEETERRLTRAWNRLDILYEETERLFKHCKATRELCELRNMINVGYLITKQAMERKESRGLHYTIDYPKKLSGETGKE